ncbi:GntR family transcriptional regulator [Paenibacillus larvae]|uniref:Transcriptional regulator-like protein n=1 Tax=Paenibacillus larvae subsp. larvae TaxID=147375 RepID=A0A6C0QT40_9BACL|nr:GntR family transcriptional regulator [Paenibacillus larvae]QHZ51915.1 transcriptional regulator-like protein [Paenibacillus larvae subsp. larvae]
METGEKLQRTFVREEAYYILRNWIVEGKLKPEQKLRDKDLAEQLGVSRTPIREALLRLEDEGLVQTQPNRATFVAPIDFHNVHHLYSIMWTLEQLALEQAFEYIKDEHIEAMAEANQRLFQALKDGERLLALEADSDFHSVYIVLSHNDELQRILSSIKQKLKRLELFYFEKAQDAHLSWEEHQRIIDTLRQRDLRQALDAIKYNWTSSFSRIQSKAQDGS